MKDKGKDGASMEEMKISQDMFEFDPSNGNDAEKIAKPSVTYLKDAIRRYRQNKVATVAMGILILILVMSVIVPMLSPYDYSMQDYLNINAKPSFQYWFGTDDLGRDIFVRCWEGARVSLMIAFVSVFLNSTIGIIYGGISGFFGGWVDNIMMRIVEVISSVPSMLWMIILTIVLKPGVTTLIIALAATGWGGMARLFRGQVLQLREMEYVQVSRTLGAKPLWVILKHLLPNAMSPIITSMAFAIPSAIFAESFLSYIGLGLPMPLASWGILASEGANKLLTYPYQLFFPAILISITMLCFNLIGDGLRDALDPNLRD